MERRVSVAGALGVAAIVLFTVGCGSAGAPSSGTTPSPSAQLTRVPSGTNDGEWSRVALVAGQRENVLAHRLAPGGPGLLAAGERYCAYPSANAPDPTACYGQLWASETGDQWTLVRDPALEVSRTMPTSGPMPGLVDVAGRADLAVLVGYALDDAGGVGVWTVTPDLEITRVPTGDAFADVRPQAVVATADAFVIVGTVMEPGRPAAAAWWSPDGVSWTRADGTTEGWSNVGGYLDTLEEPGYGGMTSATAYADGFVAVGPSCDESGSECRVAGWQSADGRTWERAAFSAEGRATAIVATPGEPIVFGFTEIDQRGLGFYAGWSHTPQTTAAGWVPIHGAAAMPGGAVVIGWHEGGQPVLKRWDSAGFGAIDLPAGTRPGAIGIVRGADIEIADSRLLVIVSAETDAGLEAFVLVGPVPG